MSEKPKWTKVTQLTDYSRKSKHSCMGMCSVSSRAHYSNPKGFLVMYTGYDRNGKQIYKGRCAGHPLNTGKVAEKVIVDEAYRAPVDWIAVADVTLEALAAAKILAEERADKLRQYSEVRKKLKSRAPKKLVRKFDRAVSYGRFLHARAIARSYGVYL